MPLIFGIFFLWAVVAVILVVSKQQQRAHRLELIELARQTGLEFIPEPGELFHRYEGIEPFMKGERQRSYNLLRGPKGPLAWEIFDYRYTNRGMSSGRQTTHFYGVVCAIVPLSLPLTIRPEKMLDKIRSAMGIKDLTIGVTEFDARFRIDCANPEFARDLFDNKIRDLLLAEQHTWHLQIRDMRVLVLQNGEFSADEINAAMTFIERFVDSIPASIKERYSAGARKNLPLDE